MLRVDIDVRGPLFDGRAGHEATAMLRDALTDVGTQGLADVRRILGQSLRHPTGHYTSRVTTERAASTVVVTDHGVVYGPWLEGTSSRNASTGFAGYRAFRKATQELQRQAPGIVDAAVRRHLAGMGG